MNNEIRDSDINGPVIQGRDITIVQHSAIETPPRYLLNGKGEIPLVREIGLRELGVHPAAQWEADAGSDAFPTYVPRDCDGEIERAFAHGGLVVVEGRSAAGKSRAAAEAMRRVAARRTLYVPQDTASLMALGEPPGRLRDAVVWLDDLERYWRQGLVDTHLMNRLSPQGSGVVVLATLRSEERRRMEAVPMGGSGSPSDGPRSFSVLLQMATIVRPAFRPSAGERERAEERRDDPRIARWLDGGGDAGMAEYLAAGPAALDRWLTGRDGAQLVGAALVSVAVDARRTGYFGALPREVLAELFPHYLDVRDARRLGSATDVEEGLAWATEPVSGASSCLLPLGDGRYGAFDYLVDHRERDEAAGPVPEAVWEAVLSRATGEELPGIINESIHESIRHDRPRVADLGLAHLDGNRDFDAVARLVSGMILGLGRTGEGWDPTERFARWLRPYVEAGNTSAMAALGAVLHLEGGRPEEGEAWMRRAADAGNDGAAADLALLLHGEGRTAEVDALLERAVADGRGSVILRFTGHLEENDEHAESGRRLRAAADAGCGLAMTLLAEQARDRGDEAEADAWYERAVAVNEPNALVNHGIRCVRRGDRERAEHLFLAAAELGEENGMSGLGNLRREDGRDEEAEEWFRRAWEAGSTEAALALAFSRYERGDSAGLAEWLERVREEKREDAGQRIFDLATMIDRADDPAGAERWYRRAAELDSAPAMTALGDLCKLRGETERAREWLRKAVGLGDPMARNGLGVLHAEAREPDEAERLFEELWATQTLGEEDARTAAARTNAVFNLGVLYERWNRHEKAKRYFREAEARGHPQAPERIRGLRAGR
ncbi:tetratricopeptide repeat protein [Streptomyces sp. NPDC048172]|uniref:tetratricopeptide repeat protein n=1 Tax=Streptomyces sp. NPDC048172 TaxID=3365505 RepID=UPI003720F1CE